MNFDDQCVRQSAMLDQEALSDLPEDETSVKSLMQENYETCFGYSDD